MGCKDTDRKYTCGMLLNSRCVTYDPPVPDCSVLSEQDCNNVEDVLKNTYDMLCALEDETDLTALGSSCIDYEEEVIGDIKVKEALLKHEELICDLLAQEQGDSCPYDITCMNLDTSCLEDICATGFNDLESLLQAMLTKICELSA